VPDASRLAEKRFHYAWVVAAVTFLVLLVTAGIRATPGVLMVPLEGEFGWSYASISAAVAINIALFGLIGPFAASLMDRFGLRRIVLCALALLAVSVGLTTQMHSRWQLTLLWGICVGSGTGVTAMVLAAVVANRWFETPPWPCPRYPHCCQCDGTTALSSRARTPCGAPWLAKRFRPGGIVGSCCLLGRLRLNEGQTR
jgi:hypothetical protein